MKIKNIRLNGNVYALDDQDALQLPEGVELQDGDVLVYDAQEQAFDCVNRNDLVDVERGIVENSQKLAKSGDVYTAINSISNSTCNLEVDYNGANNKLVFHVASGTPSALKTSVGLLVLSINTHYDSQQQELNFSNIVTILHLDENTTSVEYQLDNYIDDRQFYFVLINNNQKVQVCTINRDTILVPGVNTKTNVVLTPSVDITGAEAGAKISIISSVAVDVNINVSIDVEEAYSHRIVNGVLTSGTSQVIINVGSSGRSRICNISITPASVSSTQNYILQQSTITAPANIGLRELVITADSDTTHVHVKTIDDSTVGNDIDVILYLPRNGTSPIAIPDLIERGSAESVINYGGQSFNGPIAYVGLGEQYKDEFYEYYIQNDSVQLIVDPNSNPY